MALTPSPPDGPASEGTADGRAAGPLRRIAAAVVAIEVPDGLGAGLLLSASGLIATNQHVVEGWSTARVDLGEGAPVRARVVRSWRDPDLALLQLDEEGAHRAAGRLAPPLIDEAPEEPVLPAGRAPVLGETVYAIGHPLGLPHTVTRGIVSAEERRIDGRLHFQIDAAINPGNSGGPVVDAAGELIGLTACTRVEAEGLNFAIPAPLLYRRVAEYLRERAAGGQHYCTVCGTASRGAVYCDHCGALLALVEGADGEPAGEEPAGVGEQPEAGEGPAGEEAGDGPPAAVCPTCGAANPGGEPYCAVCGTTL